MLRSHLHRAGFFPIQWAPAAPGEVPGTTFVRPTAKGVLRVFVPAGDGTIEVYAGSLQAGKLCYRGPVHSEAELKLLLARAI
jgi:hypothetical protein